ncbi:hypothetical protein HETIRDRAFT_171598 [Heterobasidion irregulare TC 32-1]|uniref:Uncharacterized protein n=1 Tax=Heterobasidion irregulare (strain TC 32-1) TaxID=747525 RepID=W4K255_HETIT|nr:uncharacterized protein HETIRDRAFT_171598 [Heterobasidion irregulare TC 32-1]ETW79882.1 hypothetical protein HETIRDRAFT_171598 [Heterobasidion irregulare TC 32-1]
MWLVGWSVDWFVTLLSTTPGIPRLRRCKYVLESAARAAQVAASVNAAARAGDRVAARAS